jgi:hypothetical protein
MFRRKEHHALGDEAIEVGTPAIEKAATQKATAVTGIFFWSPPMRLRAFSPVFQMITPMAINRSAL